MSKYSETRIQQDERKRRFTYHSPKDHQVARMKQLRSQANELCRLIHTSCPDSRERSTALTKLDEVIMHANAAIVRRESDDGPAERQSTESPEKQDSPPDVGGESPQ